MPAVQQLFDIDIQGIVGDTFGGQLAPLAYAPPYTGGTFQPAGSWTGGTAGTSVPCEGFVSSYSDYMIATGAAKEQDRQVLILQASLPKDQTLPRTVPAVGGQVADEAGVNYRIEKVDQDPVGALWILKAEA